MGRCVLIIILFCLLGMAPILPGQFALAASQSAGNATASAEAQLVNATSTYILGDHDTLADARRACKLEAIRTLVERVGTVIEVRTEANNYVLTSDQIESFAAALLEIRDIKEILSVKDNRFVITMTVVAELDEEELGREALELARNRYRGDEIVERYEHRKRLEREEELIRQQLRGTGLSVGTTTDDVVTELQAKRRRLFTDMESLTRRKEDIMAARKNLTERATTIIEPGMLASDVLELLGPPSAATQNSQGLGTGFACMKYGEVWAVFQHNEVRCLRSALQYSRKYGSQCHCEGFFTTIIKQ